MELPYNKSDTVWPLKNPSLKYLFQIRKWKFSINVTNYKRRQWILNVFKFYWSNLGRKQIENHIWLPVQFINYKIVTDIIFITRNWNNEWLWRRFHLHYISVNIGSGLINIKTLYQSSSCIYINFNRINLFFYYLIFKYFGRYWWFYFYFSQGLQDKENGTFSCFIIFINEPVFSVFSSESFLSPWKKSICVILVSGSTAKEELLPPKGVRPFKRKNSNAPIPMKYKEYLIINLFIINTLHIFFFWNNCILTL